MDKRVATRKLDHHAPMIVTAYNNGATLAELSKTYNCAINTVRDLLIRKGITLRSKGRRRNNVITIETV